MAEKKPKRFEIAYTQGGFTNSAAVWVDRETGVNYLLINDAANGAGGLTPLLDKDGKVVVTLVESK